MFGFLSKATEDETNREDLVVGKVANMKVDMVADMKVDMVANLKLDMVADMKVDMVATMSENPWWYAPGSCCL